MNILNLSKKIKHTLWGNLSEQEFKRFALLALTFLFIIGSYWLLRPLKDSLFISITGKNYLPLAKIISFGFIIPLVLLYAKLIDLVEKQKLFYVLCSFYSIIFAIIAYLLTHPTIGLANTVPSKDRILGWFIYVAIESFGSILVTLFWSFVASSTKTASAKRGYGLIIFGAQIGSMAGPSLAMAAGRFGLPNLMIIAVVGITTIPLLVKLFITIFPTTAESSTEFKQKKKTSPIEGIKLLFTRPYLLGILGISVLYEIVGTILDLQFKFLAGDAFKGQPEQLTSFFGTYGLTTNGITFILALFGTSFFIRTFGLQFCLVAYPISIIFVVLNAWAFPLLWILFGSMVTIKALSYALNNPCKEIMYIPTSKDVKFKTKGFIDMFGSRSAKATGSGIKTFVIKLANPIMYGSLISLGIIGIWITAALFVSRKNKKLIDKGNIIE